MPIQVLPKHLVNKIAAGEVIERPASVVKELVENALDAGATRIDIAVADGGRKLISVTDDGSGMAAEDVALAFSPHATSKIAAEEDLYRIATMGFRGEALASIASISHAHLRSRRRSEDSRHDSGHEIEASGETLGQVRPCAAAPGTTVTVRDLFFNTPARRKFLRTPNTEFGHVVEQLTRLALPHCHVAFTLSHDGREVHNLPAAVSTAQRAADLFGAQLAESLLPIAPRTGKVRVAGLLAPPAAARSSTRWQYFFLNGRYIRDRLLGHALREAYRGLVDPSRCPAAMIFLELDPADVDVNVHPTKIEVRFRDSQLVHGELLAALRETLNKANLTPGASLDAAAPQPASQAAEQRRASLREALADFFSSPPPPQPHLRFGSEAPRGTQAQSPGLEAEAAPRGAAAVPAATTSSRRAVQIHDTYIVTGCEDGLLIVDQHALHERILYNELRRRLADGRLAAQGLLIPQTMDVTAGEAEALRSHAELLGRLGIEVAPFGPRTVAVQQFPSMLAGRGVPAVEFLRDFLDLVAEGEPADPERLLESLLEMMACKAAVKAGEALSEEEMSDLLRRGQAAEKGSSCPHGRPTTLKLTLRDLERQFKRT